MAQTGGCEQFQVGTRKWTQCVEDQATGGGLMPWIVVGPLAVMVVGMMIGFARQYSRAGQERARAHGPAGTAGTWLIFVSFVELAIGIGSWIAERKAPGVGGGYSSSATVLLSVGVLLFVIGVYLKIRGRRRARIFHKGIPGEALIRGVHETGTMVNNQPMYGFDLEVTGQGFAPVTTTHREVVPFWFAGRVGPDMTVPVKVDPTNPKRVIFDWERFRSMIPAGTAAATAAASAGTGAFRTADGGTATPTMPDADTMARAMEAAREAVQNQPRWHVGKVIGLVVLLFVLAVVGGGLFAISKVFSGVSDVTAEVTDQVADAFDEADNAFEGGGYGGGGSSSSSGDTTIEVSRKARGRDPVGYAVTLPAGWVDLTASEPERQGAILIDVLTKPQTPSEARIVVTRSVRFMKDPGPASAGIGSVRKEIEREFGKSLVRSRTSRLAGEDAIVLDTAPGADGLRSRIVAVMRGGQVIFVSVTAPQSEWDATLAVFDQVLASWHWGTVSA